MKVDYRFPTIVRAVPLGHRTQKNVLVELQGHVEVAGIGEEEAPVACAFEWAGLRYEYRCRDGALYAAVASRGLFEDGVAFCLITEIAARMAERRERVEPREASERLDRLPLELADRAAPGEPYADPCGGDPRIYAPLESLRKVDLSASEEWIEMANELASSAFTIDGSLWMRVPEPRFRVQRSMYSIFEILSATLVTGDLYAVERFTRMDQLNGRSPNGNLCAYWSWDDEIYSFAEIEAFKAHVERSFELIDRRRRDDEGRYGANRHREDVLRYLSTFDVRMPEAFGVGREELELVRQARLAVGHGWFDMRVGPQSRIETWDMRIPEPLRDAYRSLKRAVKNIEHSGRASGRDLGTLQRVFEAYEEAWFTAARDESFPDHMTRSTPARNMTRALTAWQERPIPLAFEMGEATPVSRRTL